LTAFPGLQAPPFQLISPVMVTAQGHLYMAASAGGARVLPVGIPTLGLVIIHVAVAALVFLAFFLVITRQNYPWQMRKEAVSLLEAAGGDVNRAVQLLQARATVMNWPWPRNPHQFIRNAKKSFDGRGSILPVKHGRKTNMPPEVEVEIINLVLHGYEHIEDIAGHQVHVHSYYRSFPEACATNGRIAQLMTQYGFRSASSLKRHLDHYHPGALHLHSGDIKQQHTPKQRAQRVDICKLALQHLQVQHHLISRVCFMDGFHVKVKPATRFAYYCSPADSLGVNMVLEVPAHLIRGKIKIHLFAVVNPFFGPIYMEFVSGTQDDVWPVHQDPTNPTRPPPTYYVSAARSQHLPCRSTLTCAPSTLAMYCGYGTVHIMPRSDTTLTCACLKL